MSNQEKAPLPISPKDFMKGRRPERFSDSIHREIGMLDRPLLEHQLTSLNRRSGELNFEEFVKKLCEKIVCPNLLAQTGPVAGGDGKVDTQTFPVSEQNSLLWYEGINDNANKERWAFAVSTQVDWKAKCRKDARKIAGTNRGYTTVFCITNQYTKSDQRSNIEDKLASETGMRVQIFDISWILDQIFKNGYEQLAIDSLAIETNWSREIKTGPNDYQKSQQLTELQRKINEEVDPQAISYRQVEWFLESALLSKEMEQAVHETQGLFDRARRVADRFGTGQQKIDAHYQYAWAALFWFEDYSLFVEQLIEVFKYITDSGQSTQWGDFVTLLSVYKGAQKQSLFVPVPKVETILEQTKHRLDQISADDTRPSNALMAMAYNEFLSLHDIENREDATPIFEKILSICKDGSILVGYPFESFFELICAVDDVFGDLEAYEKLLDYLTEQSSIRYGGIQESLLWLKRGARRLDSGQPYQAIKLVGKSLTGLYKNESRHDCVFALNVLSHAYGQVGLIWAARANLLLASSLITDEYWRSGDLMPAQTRAYRQLAMIELQLGRVCHALTWWRLAGLINAQLEEAEISESDIFRFDGFLSQCILRTNLKDLANLELLPDVLDKLELFTSRAMALYTLGHEERVCDEYETTLDSEHLSYLKKLRDYDYGVQPRRLDTFQLRCGEIYTLVLGSEITTSFPTRSPLVELAETVLAVIEAFFATGIIDDVAVVEPKVIINISADDDEEISISHEIEDSGNEIQIDVLCSAFEAKNLNVDGQRVIQNWVQDFVLEVFEKIAVPKNPHEIMKTMILDDRSLERSVSFGVCMNSQKNILGNDGIYEIKNILYEPEIARYEVRRTKPWDIDCPQADIRPEQCKKPNIGKGSPPEELLDNEGLYHTDISIHGLIKVRHWDRAGWSGVGFATYPNGTPGLLLMFSDSDAAAAIFRGLIAELSHKDITNRLRVSIIRGIDAENPVHYRVAITENPSLKEKTRVMMITRSNTMTPDTDKNLVNFLSAYEKHGQYILSYAFQHNGQMVSPSEEKNMTIIKTELNVMSAWEIGLNDFEVTALKSNDNPIIPADVENPPIIETLQRIRSSR